VGGPKARWFEQTLGFTRETSGRKLGDALMSAATRVVATDADFGARQTLYAASQDLPGNTFDGPRFGYVGRTQPVGRSRRAQDAATAAALWELSSSSRVPNFRSEVLMR